MTIVNGNISAAGNSVQVATSGFMTCSANISGNGVGTIYLQTSTDGSTWATVATVTATGNYSMSVPTGVIAYQAIGGTITSGTYVVTVTSSGGTSNQYTPSGNWPDLDGSAGNGPLVLPANNQILTADALSKSSSPRAGVLGKLIDACQWLKSNTALSGTVAMLSGAAFSGEVNLSGGAQVNNGLLIGGGSVSRPPQSVGATTTTVNVGGSSSVQPLYIADQWTGVSGTTILSFSLNAYTDHSPGGTAPFPEIEIFFLPATASSNCSINVVTVGSLTLATFVASTPAPGCTIRSRWDGTRWRCLGVVQFTPTNNPNP